jgi:hypothetical protein
LKPGGEKSTIPALLSKAQEVPLTYRCLADGFECNDSIKCRQSLLREQAIALIDPE